MPTPKGKKGKKIIPDHIWGVVGTDSLAEDLLMKLSWEQEDAIEWAKNKTAYNVRIVKLKLTEVS